MIVAVNVQYLLALDTEDTVAKSVLHSRSFKLHVHSPRQDTLGQACSTALASLMLQRLTVHGGGVGRRTSAHDDDVVLGSNFFHDCSVISRFVKCDCITVGGESKH
jgi:hypothetical protein